MTDFYHIKVRRDTAANWAANNPTPADGETCLETDTKRKKIGNGITPYNSLPYDMPGNATQSAAGLMSAADKTKLDSINMSLYAKLNSPIFTGSPKAPIATGYSMSNQLATLASTFCAIAYSVLRFVAVRVVYNAPSAGEYQIISDDGLNECTFIGVNGEAKNLELKHNLESGLNFVDFIFCDFKTLLNNIPNAAFKDVAEVYAVYIPESVITIGNDAFNGTGLEYVYALGSIVPTLGSGVIDSTPIQGGAGKVYTPEPYLSYYQASAWNVEFPAIEKIN